MKEPGFEALIRCTIAALLACLVGLGCAALNFPTDQPGLSDEEIIPYPLPPPPAHQNNWAELEAPRRQATPLGQNAAAQAALLAALKQTRELPAQDIRVQTSLMNVIRLVEELQESGLDERAGLLIELLIDDEGRGHPIDFGMAGSVVLVHVAVLVSQGELDRAQEVLRSGLRLKDAGNPANARLRRKAESELSGISGEAFE